MVDEIRVYYKGDPKLRAGFIKFSGTIAAAARDRRTKLAFVSGGSKSATIKDFVLSTRSRAGALTFLLVDADVEGSTAELLRQTRADAGWDGSMRVSDEQLHFMVQVMESWFLADTSALTGYYGSRFRARSLPSNPDVEAIPKSDVESKLKAATANATKGEYHKTRHATSLLERIDPDVVRKAAPRCDRLFSALEDALI